jgi:hypothetical protein
MFAAIHRRLLVFFVLREKAQRRMAYLLIVV